MVTKTQIATELWTSGEKSKALKIFKTFKSGITKEERDTLITTFEMDYEITTKGCSMYEKFGYDLTELWEMTSKIIQEKLIKCQKAIVTE